MAGPFPPAVYNDISGNANFTLSEVTGLSVACLQVGW